MISKMLSVIFAVLLSSASFGAEVGAEGISTAQSKSMIDDLYLNYFATFNGPGITNLDNDNAPTTDGLTRKNKKAYGHLNFDSEIVAAYLITPTIGMGPVVPFILYPTEGYGAVLGDVGIKAFNKKFITNRNFTVSATLILQLPSSDNSKNNGMDIGVKMTPSTRYTIPNSRFTLGAFTEEKSYLGVHQGSAKAPMKSFKLFALPYINYLATPKFSWNLGFEMEASHFNHTTPMDFKMVKTDLQPGFVYMVTPRILVNPFIQIFTSEKVAFDRTALSAVVSATL